VAAVQRNFGAKVYFNPFVRLDGVLLKYGVVTVDDMAEDLRHWESLYLAGRLHKPVVELQPDAAIAEAQAVNKAAALTAALLLLPRAGFAEVCKPSRILKGLSSNLCLPQRNCCRGYNSTAPFRKKDRHLHGHCWAVVSRRPSDVRRRGPSQDSTDRRWELAG
jgi:hypothetical protein